MYIVTCIVLLIAIHYIAVLNYDARPCFTVYTLCPHCCFCSTHYHGSLVPCMTIKIACVHACVLYTSWRPIQVEMLCQYISAKNFSRPLTTPTYNCPSGYTLHDHRLKTSLELLHVYTLTFLINSQCNTIYTIAPVIRLHTLSHRNNNCHQRKLSLHGSYISTCTLIFHNVIIKWDQNCFACTWKWPNVLVSSSYPS